MCYLCTKDDPFKVPEVKDLENKRSRVKQIKELLDDIEGTFMCDTGQVTVKGLKEELYVLSREL